MLLYIGFFFVPLGETKVWKKVWANWFM
jgi:hypothetical protein